MVFAAGVPEAFESYAVAQQRGPVQRIVQGKVTDQNNAALKGSVVYLKDGHSLSVKSFIADDQGEYRFGQLAQNTDYEIWAENNGKKSKACITPDGIPLKAVDAQTNQAMWEVVRLERRPQDPALFIVPPDAQRMQMPNMPRRQ